MIIMLPEFAEWIAQRLRMSGKSVIGMISRTPLQHRLAMRLCQLMYLERVPDVIGLLSLHLKTQLLSHPRMGAVTANNVLGLDCVLRSCALLLSQKVGSVI